MLKKKSSPRSVADVGTSDGICTYCEEVVNYAKILLESPQAEQEIEALLSGMCTIAGPLQDFCENVIKGNIADLIHMVAHTDTKTVCVFLNMCSR